jgi:hypothetical protein
MVLQFVWDDKGGTGNSTKIGIFLLARGSSANIASTTMG